MLNCRIVCSSFVTIALLCKCQEEKLTAWGW